MARLGCAVPVVQGATRALCEDPAPWRALLDKRVEQLDLMALWQGVPQPAALPADGNDAAEAMGQLICDNPGEITLIAIGPLTNVALAMQRFPAMAESVAEIVIMGVSLRWKTTSKTRISVWIPRRLIRCCTAVPPLPWCRWM